MFNALLKTSTGLSPSLPPSTCLEKLQPEVPQSFTLRQLVTGIVESEVGNQTAAIAALYACINNKRAATIDVEDDHSLSIISDFIANALLPVSTSSTAGSFDDSLASPVTIFKAHLGLSLLQSLKEDWDSNLTDKALLTLVAFADHGNPWSTPKTRDVATSVLLNQGGKPFLGGDRLSDFITETILLTTLQPLFSKSRPATVTLSGRKAAFPEEERNRYSSMNNDTPECKPWKFRDVYAIPIFTWAVDNAQEELISKSWHLFTPVLLSLLDDGETRVRIRGLKSLARFCHKFPGRMLQETGLGHVFEEAVFPTVLFLPSLTPEQESLQLLPPAYGALLIIASKLPDDDSAAIERTGPQTKNRLLDKMLRHGVFVGYDHAKTHIRITETLLDVTISIIDQMGISAVKHLKDLIPMLSEVMNDPFVPNWPPALIASLRVLQGILKNCWPRVSYYMDEALKMLTVCWLNLEEVAHNNPQAESARDEIVKAVKILSAAMKTDNVELSERIAPVLEIEPGVRRLFMQITG